MRLLLVIDSHIYKTKDGKYWCKGITDINFFRRYLNVFEELTVVSRVKYVESIDKEKFLDITNNKIQMIDIPFARKSKEYIKNYFKIKKMVKNASKECQCIIYRVPSVLSYIAYFACKKRSKVYGVEVVADPEDAYKDKKLLKKIFTIILKKIVMNANGASYVTEHSLQEKYPSKAKTEKNLDKYFETFYSSVELQNWFFGKPKQYLGKKDYIISHTANISNSMAKGQDILIRAVGELVKKGFDLRIKFIGDSEIKEKYYEIAKEYGIENRIKFTGMLAKKEDIRKELIESDIYVLPTKAEGLPRSILEAMAVGLPSISTPVGGIPELLPKELMVEQSNYIGFANVIEKLIKNTSELERLSKNNIEIAKKYSDDILSKKRNDFYGKLKKIVVGKENENII